MSDSTLLWYDRMKDTINKIINSNGGIDDFRCFVYRPISKQSEPTWAECKIFSKDMHDRCSVHVILSDKDNRVAPYIIEYPEFLSMIKNGSIIIKTNPSQHITKTKWYEPLSELAYLVHEADIITD